MKLSILCASLIMASPALAGQPKASPNSLIDHPAPPKFDASGVWQVEGHITARGKSIASTRLVCLFQQQNGALAGSCRGPNSQGPLQGIVYGKHVRWSWQAVPRTEKSPPGLTTFDGELAAAGTLKGLWTFSGLPGLTGRFTATRLARGAP